MNNKTKELGLVLTGADEAEKTFQQFRLELSGNTGSSNMEIIDKAFGELITLIGNKKVYLRAVDGYVQYSEDDQIWHNVIALSELKGAKGDSGVHVGSDAPPAGIKVWVNPNGKNAKIPQVDDTLTQPGYAADAKTVGKKFEQFSQTIGDLEDKNVEYIESQTLRVGDNVLTDDMVTLGAGWSGNLTTGFTHTSGRTEPLTFAIGAADGEVYLVDGTDSGYNQAAIALSLGDSPTSEPYNGTPKIQWG